MWLYCNPCVVGQRIAFKKLVSSVVHRGGYLVRCLQCYRCGRNFGLSRFCAQGLTEVRSTYLRILRLLAVVAVQLGFSFFTSSFRSWISLMRLWTWIVSSALASSFVFGVGFCIASQMIPMKRFRTANAVTRM